MEKGHEEKVHSTYENHNENIGKKTTLNVKTTVGKTANWVKMGRGYWGSGPVGAGPCRANAKHLCFLLLSEKHSWEIIICIEHCLTCLTIDYAPDSNFGIGQMVGVNLDMAIFGNYFMYREFIV